MRFADWLREGWPFGSRARPRQPDLAVHQLERAFREPGCPLCVLVQETDWRGLWILLWEHVNDPGVRGELLASLGFCPDHWRGLDQVGRREGLGVMGQAILGQSVVAEVARRLRCALAGGAPLASALDVRAACPQCRQRAFAERSYLEELGRWLDEPLFRAMYERTDGLCLPHLRALPHGRASAELLGDGIRRLEQLAEQPGRPAGLDRRAAEGASASGPVREIEWRLWGWRWPPLHVALAPARCPACQRQLAAEAAALARWAAQPSDPPCPEHAAWARARWECSASALADRAAAAAKAAVGELVERWAVAQAAPASRPSWWPRPAPGAGPPVLPTCPICVQGAQAAEAACREPRLGAGELICLPHLRLALRGPAALSVVPAERAALEELAGSLGAFVRKLDWNCRHEPRGEEQTSWPRARAFLVGPERGAAMPAEALGRPARHGDGEPGLR